MIPEERILFHGQRTSTKRFDDLSTYYYFFVKNYRATSEFVIESCLSSNGKIKT